MGGKKVCKLEADRRLHPEVATLSKDWLFLFVGCEGSTFVDAEESRDGIAGTSLRGGSQGHGG